ncbi:MAG: OmpA family protein [Bernardetiaceae bacterium]|nr:OmpA family protein [Bernardetiaceae bacterium]
MLLFLAPLGLPPAQAQVLPFGKKKGQPPARKPETEREVKNKRGGIFGDLPERPGRDGVRMQAFEPEDTTQAIDETRLMFRSINRPTPYQNANQMALLNHYQRDKKWEEEYHLLLKYVSRFSVANFTDPQSMDLVWQLVRVSEYLGHTDITKEAYRLILKHFRGDLRQAIRRYDSLSRFERPMYVGLERYYEMLELRKDIDTLKPPQGVLLNMGQEINSTFEDYGITLSRDDKTMIFTSRRHRGPGAATVNGKPAFNEDLFVARRIGDDHQLWEQAHPFADLNSGHNEGSPCISADGNTLIFARCDAPDGKGNCDLYVSQRVDNRYWDDPKPLANINSAGWDSHPSFSVTEDTLFFASDRQGGFGGADIYFSVRDPRGFWALPRNLGPVVNTRKNEVSPFLHHRYNVLYFSSDGQLLNFGDFDIYKTHFVGGRWSEPKNLGPLVNSEGREFYFAIDAASEKLYYARAEKGNDKSLDIFSFPMPMEARPTATVRFTGRVKEAQTGEVFKGEVHLIDLDERVEIMPRHIRDDGSFEFELIKDRRYMIIVRGEKFFRIQEIFFIEGDKDVNLAARSIKNIKFESIEFEENRAKILPAMEADLKSVVDFLVDYPEYNLKISGHTDAAGNAAQNLKLSQERASNIADYLVQQGQLDPRRITAVGYGSKRPLVKPEKSEQDRKLNRRVEFRIYKRGSDDEKEALN